MDRSEIRVLSPLLTLCVVVALVALGLSHGLWWDNLHNGLLALSLGIVGAVVLFGRPGHREGLLLLAAGVLQAAMFAGRQVGHFSTAPTDRWWGWLGTWPLGLTIATVTWCVLCFPEGRFLSAAWQRIGILVAVVGAGISLISALWPVEYDAAGVRTPHPLSLDAFDTTVSEAWHVVAHPAYLLFQVLWVAAIFARWRVADRTTRGQLVVVLGAVSLSVVALLAGLVVAGTPRAGITLAALVPIAAGWAIARMSLARVIEKQAEAGRLDGLSPRENDVLALMALGLSNAAIAQRLHLSIKTVEPVVSSIFAKLNLPSGSDSNRRVLAVVEYLRR